MHTGRHNAQSLESLAARLVHLEAHFGGLVDRVPRKIVSPVDPRTPEQIADGGYRGGDRMNPELHNYAPTYAENLRQYLGRRDLVICEVGILTGIGLAIWSEVFPGSTIIGLDIDLGHMRANLSNLLECGAFKSRMPELHAFDQFTASPDRFAQILRGRKIDILIDDGFHSDETILKTVTAALPHMAKNFVIFAEDNGSVNNPLALRFPSLRVNLHDYAIAVVRPAPFAFTRLADPRYRKSLRRSLRSHAKTMPRRMLRALTHLRPHRRRVVYTCLVGYSEHFADWSYGLDGETDYICFTDDRTLRSDVWQFRYVDPSELGPVRTAKKVKILPHQFLPEYDASLYIDNTVLLTVPASHVFQSLRPDSRPMVCFKHPDRDCIYDEAEVVRELGLDSEEIIARQMQNYRDAGYPAHAGLIAGTMLLRRHNDPRVKAVMEQWFTQVCQHSYRDQLSFNVVARQNGFPVDHFPGSLVSNNLMHWPILRDMTRVPRGFRDDRYLELHPDVRQLDLTPRQHYLLHGAKEGRAWK